MYKFELINPTFLPDRGCSISLPLEKGDGLILTGENGIGKTTLVSQFFHRHRGDGLSLVDQSSMDFFYDRKLREFKRILLSSRKEEMDLSFFQQFWEQFGLHLKEDRNLAHLSGGEAQALKLCCGLAKRGGLYLLDEPVQSLDKEKKVILAQILSGMRKAGKSFIIIEHDTSWLLSHWKVYPLILIENVLKVGESWSI